LDKGFALGKSKAFDGSAVIGEFLAKEQFSSLENLTFELTNNGNSTKGNTVLCCGKLIDSYVSQYFTLKIGILLNPAESAAVKSDDILKDFRKQNYLEYK
jgi:2-keto-4-pentenoate hydratase/2-oxohepta-3-ene-1,7-dioic acid hydratase in catechol pathway